MPGLFGYKQNPKTTEMFARMSAGERFGQAVGNANQSQITRDADAVELERQRGMDDLKTQVSQAQIRNYDRGSPSSSFTEAQFLFPDDVDQQRKHVMNKFNQGNPSGQNEFAYVQTLNPAQKEEYFRLKRAAVIRDTGRGIERFTPGSDEGVVLPGSSTKDLRTNEVDTQTDLLENEAEIKRNQDALNESMAAYTNINTGRMAINKAIGFIDAGAKTGTITNLFPSLTAATISLQDVQKNMGLDVVGNVTFGALSKGELDLALDVALPTDLTPVALRAWLVEKQRVQEILASYQLEAIRFIRNGGSVADWVLQNEGTMVDDVNPDKNKDDKIIMWGDIDD